MRALKFLVFIFFVYLFLFYPRFSFAATQSLSVNNAPLTIDQAKEFDVGISFLCPNCGDSYLRAVFYPIGASYFGYTLDNNGNWSNAPGGSCTTYYKVAQADLNKDGTWSGTLKVKPDKDSTYYNGPGEYLFKVGRYTPSCSSPSVWSTETTIAITGPTPTPTPAPTNLPATVSSASPTRSPTPAPTVKPSVSLVTPLVAKAGSISAVPLNSSLDTSVLGAENSTLSPSPKQDKNLKTPSLFAWGKLFMLMGVVIICSACGILIYKKYRQEREEEI